MKDVKKCPLCGRQPEFVMKRSCCGYGEYPMFGHIVCHHCSIRTDDFIVDGFYGCKFTVDTVVDHWNSFCKKIRGDKK